MTRIDMTTREWHELIRPVLPHVGTDKESPELGVIRVEVAEQAVYAVATDRYTIAAERHWMRGERLFDLPGPIHIARSDAAASLKVFGFSKDEDPPLQVIIDTVPVSATVVGRAQDFPRLAITLQAYDGTRLVLHDHREPSLDPLASWRKVLRQVVTRDQAEAAPALSLNASFLARWGAAVRKGERLAIFTGSKEAELLLVLVESHFCGVWKPVAGPAKMLDDSPWPDELYQPGDDEVTP